MLEICQKGQSWLVLLSYGISQFYPNFTTMPNLHDSDNPKKEAIVIKGDFNHNQAIIIDTFPQFVRKEDMKMVTFKVFKYNSGKSDNGDATKP